MTEQMTVVVIGSFQNCSQGSQHKTNIITLVLLNPDIPWLNKQCRSSSEANWSVPALFVIKYVNLYQQPWARNLTGWQLEVGVANKQCILLQIWSKWDKKLTLKMPRKPASENVVCWMFLQTFQTYFWIQTVWSRSKTTFKITSRWQSRWQLLWLAVFKTVLKGATILNI